MDQQDLDRLFEIKATPRTGRKGGWRGSPASLEALARSRVPWSALKRCKRCNGVALKGRDVCQHHSKRIPWTNPITPKRQVLRQVRRLIRHNQLPDGLATHPAFIVASTGRGNVARGFLMRDMIAAYVSGDPARWAQVLATARKDFGLVW